MKLLLILFLVFFIQRPVNGSEEDDLFKNHPKNVFEINEISTHILTQENVPYGSSSLVSHTFYKIMQDHAFKSLFNKKLDSLLAYRDQDPTTMKSRYTLNQLERGVRILKANKILYEKYYETFHGAIQALLPNLLATRFSPFFIQEGGPSRIQKLIEDFELEEDKFKPKVGRTLKTALKDPYVMGALWGASTLYTFFLFYQASSIYSKVIADLNQPEDCFVKDSRLRESQTCFRFSFDLKVPDPDQDALSAARQMFFHGFYNVTEVAGFFRHVLTQPFRKELCYYSPQDLLLIRAQRRPHIIGGLGGEIIEAVKGDYTFYTPGFPTVISLVPAAALYFIPLLVLLMWGYCS